MIAFSLATAHHWSVLGKSHRRSARPPGAVPPLGEPPSTSVEEEMYSKPKVERFGPFRDLTRTGFEGGGDGCIVLNPDGGAVVDGNPNDGSVSPTLPGCPTRS